MKTLCWEVNPQTNLESILYWCLKNENVDRLLVAARLSKSDTNPMLEFTRIDETVKTIFGKNIISSFLAKGWPGTKLVNHRGRVYLIEFDERILLKMKNTENKLFSWIHTNNPLLPEDICLFKYGEKLPRLVSVTHEGEAWILTEKMVALPGVFKSRLSIKDLFIHEGKHFCEM